MGQAAFDICPPYEDVAQVAPVEKDGGVEKNERMRNVQFLLLQL